MYDEFSSDYDRFVDWESRLAFELPLIEKLLPDLPEKPGSPPQVLDAACGTGMHAIALARRGYGCAGADLSTAMVAKARENADAAGVAVDFRAAGFGALAQAFGARRFDAVLCLGNSLPHVLTGDELVTALADFAACLNPGGLLLVQNRNFDAVLARRERWMEPQSHREGESEWVFLRFYDYDPDGLITFHVLTLQRKAGDAGWQQRIASTRLYPLRQSELSGVLERTGFHQAAWYGSLDGSPFDPGNSGNLVVAARRA